MGASTHDLPPGSTMSLAARAAFVLVPATALAVVLWLWATQTLPATLLVPWMPSAGIDFTLRFDGLSGLMLLLITGVGTAVFVYAGGYLAGHPQQNRLYIVLIMFMLAMIGCVTADNIILVFVFWELTSLTSFLLVGFNHTDLSSRKSAQQAFIVTGSGGLAMLAGLLMMGQIFGTYSLSEIIAAAPGTEDPRLTAALLLVILGCFTKSAQFPFHFWLPNAMSAPTPVSAYLHSATMVKLGVYLLARLDPGFGHLPVWTTLLTVVGAITGAWAMLLALRERDLKRILAWSTVATLGTLVMLIGLNAPSATIAVATLLLAHALYKAPLFFVAGNVDHGTGTRIIDRLGNLRHKMPFTAAAALIAGASMAGLPLSFGYVAKDVIGAAKSTTDFVTLVTAANQLFTVVAIAVAAIAALRVFWRHPGENAVADAHEGDASLVGPPLVLASIGVLLGVMPSLAAPLVSAAAQAMTPGAAAVPIALELHLGSTLISVAVAVAMGAVVFWFWDPLHRLFEKPGAALQRIGSQSWYERFINGVPPMSAALTRRIQGGSLSSYMMVLVGTILGALLLLMFAFGVPSFGTPQSAGASVGGIVAVVLVAVGAVLSCVLRNRLTLLLASGFVGYGSAVFFLFAGAPDLAFTQITVETIFVIVFASVLLRLKLSKRQDSLAHEPIFRPGAAVLAIVLAAILTLMYLWAVGLPFDRTIPDYFGQISLSEAFGRNVTNVVIVDFRGMDTFGEIAVVLFSLMAALPLLQALRRRPAKSGDEA